MALINLKQINGGTELRADATKAKADAASALEQVATAQGEIDALETVVAGIDGKIATAKSEAIASANEYTDAEIAKVQSQVTDHAGKISGLEEADVQLSGRIDALESGEGLGQHTHQAAEVTFEASMLTVSPLGGIKANEDLNGQSIQAVLTKLLYPHVDHQVSNVSSTPNGGTFECGNAQTVTAIKGTVTKKSNPITKVEVLNGSEVVGVKEGSEVANGGTFTFPVNISVETNKNFTFRAYANGENGASKAISANTGSFNFVYPYYMGVCEEGASIDEALVKGLTKKIEAKGNKSHSFTCDFQRMVFAYPKSHGALKQILDPNNFDVTGTFGRQEVTITGLDGKPVAYYVYVNSASTVSGFTVRFNY